MTKMGAVMAQGIVDAGGRNVTIGLRARSGFPRMTAVVSMLVFTQYWYWYPLSYFVSLTFVPTAFIGLDATLKDSPHCSVTSHCKPRCSRTPRPPRRRTRRTRAKSQAVLSTTAKAQAKAARRDAEKRAAGEDVAMETEEAEKKEAPETGDEEKKPEDETKPPEPSKEELENPGAVTPAQERFTCASAREAVSCPPSPGWRGKTRGFVVLKDTTPGEEVEYVASTRTIVPGVTGPAGGSRRRRRARARGARRAGGALSLTPTTCEGDKDGFSFHFRARLLFVRGFGSESSGREAKRERVLQECRVVTTSWARFFHRVACGHRERVSHAPVTIRALGTRRRQVVRRFLRRCVFFLLGRRHQRGRRIPICVSRTVCPRPRPSRASRRRPRALPRDARDIPVAQRRARPRRAPVESASHVTDDGVRLELLSVKASSGSGQASAGVRARLVPRRVVLGGAFLRVLLDPWARLLRALLARTGRERHASRPGRGGGRHRGTHARTWLRCARLCRRRPCWWATPSAG